MVIPSWCQIHWLYYCHGSSYLLCYLELLATPVIRHVFSHRMTGMRTIPGPDGEQHCRALWYSFIKKKKRFIKSTVTKKIITLRLSKQTLYYYVSSIVLGGEIQGKGNTFFFFIFQDVRIQWRNKMWANERMKYSREAIQQSIQGPC